MALLLLTWTYYVSNAPKKGKRAVTKKKELEKRGRKEEKRKKESKRTSRASVPHSEKKRKQKIHKQRGFAGVLTGVAPLKSRCLSD